MIICNDDDDDYYDNDNDDDDSNDEDGVDDDSNDEDDDNTCTVSGSCPIPTSTIVNAFSSSDTTAPNAASIH